LKRIRSNIADLLWRDGYALLYVFGRPFSKALIYWTIVGADVQSWSDEGERVPDGSQGNMVCTNIIPNMPVNCYLLLENVLLSSGCS